MLPFANRFRFPVLFLAIFCLSPKFAGIAEDNEAKEPSDEDKAPTWDIEHPPGPTREQPIDVNEGTWVSLDISPDGKEIVFDLLGDIYRMPIEGADGSEGVYPEKLTSGMAWDMQPRYSPNGKRRMEITQPYITNGQAYKKSMPIN